MRLWELWYQQKFSDKFDLKIGEQSLDEEFIISSKRELPVHQRGVRLAGASNGGFARRRPRLSARGLRGSRTRAG